MKKLSELKILIVGLGQIGGSLGMDLIDKSISGEVIGYDLDPAIAGKARKVGAINRKVDSLDQGLAEADLIVLAAPIRAIIKMVPIICTRKKPEAAVVDMAGTRMEIMDAVSSVMNRGNFIGAHPLAGNQVEGLEGAGKGKFKDCVFALTLLRGTEKAWLNTVNRLILKLGARPVLMKADEHDRLITLTSHLPYALAVGLMNLAAERGMNRKHFRDLIGGSFMGSTRVALSPEDLTMDMFFTNKTNLVKAMDGMIDNLTDMRKILADNDEQALRKLVRKAKTKRQKF